MTIGISQIQPDDIQSVCISIRANKWWDNHRVTKLRSTYASTDLPGNVIQQVVRSRHHDHGFPLTCFERARHDLGDGGFVKVSAHPPTNWRLLHDVVYGQAIWVESLQRVQLIAQQDVVCGFAA